MNLIFTEGFPMKELKGLHIDLSELETYILMRSGKSPEGVEKVEKIWAVQRILENLIADESWRIRMQKNEMEKSQKQ